MPAPKNVKEVKQFLGLIGYYRKFVPRFADMSKPLTCLTRHDEPFVWTERCEKSFNNLRVMLTLTCILILEFCVSLCSWIWKSSVQFGFT